MRFLVALLSCAAICCGARVDDPQDYPGGLGGSSGASSSSSGGGSGGGSSSGSSTSSGGPAMMPSADPGDDSGTPNGPTNPGTTSDGGPVTWTVTPNSDTNIMLAPSLVEATRFPVTCGVMNPPFQSGDVYSIDIVGQKTAGPENAITISFTSPAAPLKTPISLAVQPYVAMANGNGTSWFGAQSANGGGYDFQYSQGSQATEIDAGAFDSVVLTLLAMPSKDGQPLTMRIRIHFVDGQTLDYTFAPVLTSSWSGCPAG